MWPCAHAARTPMTRTQATATSMLHRPNFCASRRASHGRCYRSYTQQILIATMMLSSTKRNTLWVTGSRQATIRSEGLASLLRRVVRERASTHAAPGHTTALDADSTVAVRKVFVANDEFGTNGLAAVHISLRGMPSTGTASIHATCHIPSEKYVVAGDPETVEFKDACFP